MADVRKTIAVVFEGKDDTGPAIAGVESGLNRVKASSDAGAERLRLLSGGLKTTGDEAGKAGTRLQEASEHTDTFGKRTGAAVASTNLLVTALLTLISAGVGRAFLDANVDLEKFSKTMVATTGSATLAAEAYDYVRAVANRFGIEVGAAADGFAKFSAATKGTALEGEGAQRIFEAFAGTMSRLGSSSADINGAFVQLAQGISKGKFELEDLKSIAERVPGFFDALAKSLSITTPALFDLISAGGVGAVEIAKFAEALNNGLDGATFDGYTNSLSRLQNALTDLFQAIGGAGVMDAFTEALKFSTKSVEATGTSFDELKTFVSAAFDVMRGGSLDTFGVQMELLGRRTAGTNAKLDLDLNQTLAETNRLLRQSSDAAKNLPLDNEAAKFIRQMNESAQSVKDVALAFDTLGVKRDKVKKDIGEIITAFETLANSPSVKGSEVLAGFEAALKRVSGAESLNRLGDALSKAFAEGKLSAQEFDSAVALLVKTQEKLRKGTDDSAESLKKQAAAAEKAKERAENFRLEMEKLASNERIKNIEARVTLDVANIQEQTKRVQAAFESLDNTVTNTGEALSDLFKLFASDNLSFSALSDIRDQIDLENKRRDEALRLQGELTRAQIEQIRAQTKSMNRGDALIKIDGAGLQPHLEAFMWEILKAVQVRVNAQGLSLLLGV